jgi:hypothetical protein
MPKPLTFPKDTPILATKGLIGWHVNGRCGDRSTYSIGPYDDLPECQHAIDMSAVYERQGLDNAARAIWRRPDLDLSLPDNNVRSLFEGCIGHPGKTSGHAWDGTLESLQSCDSVGLIPYMAVLLAAGGVKVK